MGSLQRFALFVLALGMLALAAPAAASAASLSVSVSGAGSGTVTSKPGTVNCVSTAGTPSGTCFDGALPNNTEIGMAATAEPGSVFAGWSVGSGGCTGLTNPCQFKTGVFGGETNLTAQFIVAPDPPIATAADASPGPNELLLQLNGAVNPNDFKVSSCRFEYDSRPYEPGEGRHGASAPCTPAASALGEGGEPVEVSALAELEQLTPETTYHYRLIATNLGGGGESEARTFLTGPAPPDACPNAAIRATQPLGAIALPGCMALEQVSPAQKTSQLTLVPAISDDGDRVAFKGTGAFAETPSFTNPLATYYVAGRTAAGWVTSPSAASGLIVNGAKEFGQPLTYSPDFSRWLTIGSTELQFPQGIARAYRYGVEAPFEPVSPLLVPITDAAVSHNLVWGTTIKGVSADHSRLYFSPGDTVAKTEVAYHPEDPEPRGDNPHVYIAGLDSGGEPALELAARDSEGKVWGGRCGALLGGAHRAGAPTGRNQGAVSTDGSRVYLSTRPSQPEGEICRASEHPLRILKRLETTDGPWISELFASECKRGSPPCAASGDDYYEGASLDQTKVYFTTSRQLADSDLDTVNNPCSDSTGAEGCDLYLYDSTKPGGQRLTQVSTGEDASPGAGAKVIRKITAVSTDGSHAYFVAHGVLSADPNPAGQSAEEGQPNLYAYDAEAGEVSFVGILHSGDEKSLWGRAGGFVNNAFPAPAKGTDAEGNEVGGAGHLLLFITKAALDPDDADGARADVYRYDTGSAGPEALRCLSCLPGGPDAEPFDVEPSDRGGGLGVANEIGTDLVEFNRWASEDGDTVAFVTSQALVPGDVNQARDAYLWDGGQLSRLPGRIDGGINVSAAVSADGGEVAFASFASLVPFDTDTALDIYVARAGGGFPPPAPPAPCQGEGCQEPFASQPGERGVGSEAETPGNVVGRSADGPRRCPKGKARRGKRCVAKRALARRACAKRRGEAKRRCVRKQVRRLNRAQQRRNRANPDRRAAK